MPLRARNNNFGSFLYKGSRTRYFGYRNVRGSGEDGQDTVMFEEHACGRSPHTVNPEFTLHGFPHRADSAYNRFVFENEPFVGSSHFISPSDGTRYYRRETVWPFTFSDIMTPYGGYSVNGGNPFIVNLRRRATVECLQKLGGAKAQLGALAGETIKSYKRFVSTVASGVSAVRAVKRGNMKLAAYHLGLNQRFSSKLLAGTYLRYSYGWKPLVGDIVGTYEAFQRNLEKGMLLSAKRVVSTSDVTPPNINNGWEGSIKDSVKVIVGLTGYVDDTYVRMSQDLGLHDPWSVGWELVPFSFLVDWLIPIGDVLEAYHAPCGLVFHSGYITTVLEKKWRISHTQPGWTIEEPSGFKGRSFTMGREPLNGFPRPVPYFESPFKTGRAINAAALARSLAG